MEVSREEAKAMDVNFSDCNAVKKIIEYEFYTFVNNPYFKGGIEHWYAFEDQLHKRIKDILPAGCTDPKPTIEDVIAKLKCELGV
jgi:hypothetical protein